MTFKNNLLILIDTIRGWSQSSMLQMMWKFGFDYSCQFLFCHIALQVFKGHKWPIVTDYHKPVNTEIVGSNHACGRCPWLILIIFVNWLRLSFFLGNVGGSLWALWRPLTIKTDLHEMVQVLKLVLNTNQQIDQVLIHPWLWKFNVCLRVPD